MRGSLPSQLPDVSESSPASRVPGAAESWSRRQFLVAAAAAPLALGLPLPPADISRILRARSRIGTAYYASAAGDDDNDGTSSDAPWRTLARLSEGSYGPGDQILLRAGDTFAGPLSLHADNSAATPLWPLRISRYGAGSNPVISAADNAGSGMSIREVAALVIEDLDLVGPGHTVAEADGLHFRNERAGLILPHVRIRRVRAMGFSSGIGFGSWAGHTGYSDVLVEDCELHDNVNGLHVFAEWRRGGPYYRPHTDFTARRVVAHHNRGRPGINSGFGIVWQGIIGGAIEDCEAYENGELGGSRQGGPVGIMLYLCEQVTIQRCYSHDNHSAVMDGGGIDIDGGCVGCVIQYCYTRRNKTFGYFLANFDDAGLYSGNVLRYSISEMDRRERSSPHGGISIWNHSRNAAHDFVDTHVYGNTVYVDDTSPGNARALQVLRGGGTLRTRIYNNILIARGGKQLIDVSGGQTDLRLQGNNYHTYGDPVLLQWDGTSYSSLEALRDGTGQERLEGEDVGTDADPLLTAPGAGGYVAGVEQLRSLHAYRLQPASLMPTAGVDLRALGVDLPAEDFYGAENPPEGPFRAVGAATTAIDAEDGATAAVRSA